MHNSSSFTQDCVNLKPAHEDDFVHDRFNKGAGPKLICLTQCKSLSKHNLVSYG